MMMAVMKKMKKLPVLARQLILHNLHEHNSPQIARQLSHPLNDL